MSRFYRFLAWLDRKIDSRPIGVIEWVGEDQRGLILRARLRDDLLDSDRRRLYDQIYKEKP